MAERICLMRSSAIGGLLALGRARVLDAQFSGGKVYFAGRDRRREQSRLPLNALEGRGEFLLQPAALKALRERLLPMATVLRCRVLYFSRGAVLGSTAFVEKQLERLKQRAGGGEAPPAATGGPIGGAAAPAQRCGRFPAAVGHCPVRFRRRPGGLAGGVRGDDRGQLRAGFGALGNGHDRVPDRSLGAQRIRPAEGDR